jgi:addiction module HigA family antidote
MMMNKRTVHPGEVLGEELQELGISPTELSRQIAVPPTRISQIIHGKRDVSADTALRLGHWFGTSAQFWTNLQNQFDLAVARERAGESIAALPTRPEVRKTDARA